VNDSETIDERTIAYHEAGHALQYFLQGCEVECAELTMGEENHAYVKPVSASSAKLVDAQHVRISLAGIAAEFVLGKVPAPSTADALFDIVFESAGWEPDWDRAHHYALQVAGEEKNEGADEFRFQHFRDVLALQSLHRDKAARVATHLLKQRRLTGERLKSLLGAR